MGNILQLRKDRLHSDCLWQFLSKGTFSQESGLAPHENNEQQFVRQKIEEDGTEVQILPWLIVTAKGSSK